MPKELNVNTAIELLKSGGNLDEVTIPDLTTAKVRMMDALLLARNGFVIPEENVVYEDDQIQYDPDFDDMPWGKPVPFKKLKPSLDTSNASIFPDTATEPGEDWQQTKADPIHEAQQLITVTLSLRPEIKQWLLSEEIDLMGLLEGAVEEMYNKKQGNK